MICNGGCAHEGCEKFRNNLRFHGAPLEALSDWDSLRAWLLGRLRRYGPAPKNAITERRKTDRGLKARAEKPGHGTLLRYIGDGPIVNPMIHWNDLDQRKAKE